MAPAQQNVEMCGQHIKPEIKQRTVAYKSDVSNYENNNSVSVEHSDEVNEEFDINEYEEIEFKADIRWPDLIAQVSLHSVTLYGLYLIISLQVKILTILFVLGTIYTSGLGITAGVHRLWSHRAYKARLPLRILLAILFTVTGQRDIYTWALDHRVHHKYTETVADPHDARRGFWFAHVGWLFLTPHPAVENRREALRKTSLDLMDDPVVRIQKLLFIPMFVILNVAIPTWIPWYCWDESVVISFVISFVTRFTATLNIAYSVNSFAHMWGDKPYDRFITSVENGIVSLAALGEGWHNFHHVFPWDYRTSELGRVNISTNFIDACAKIGWAYDLKAATVAMVKNRAIRTGDGSFHEPEEPYPGEDETRK